jgi:nucleotide-binding universal stress UspA family protein
MVKTKRGAPHNGRRSHPKTILVPIDFSAASKEALRQALHLAGEGTRLMLLHVLAPSADAGRVAFNSAAAAKKGLLTFGRNHGADHDRAFHSLVRAGVPFQEILTTAHEHHAEMIVLGVNNSASLGGIELGHTVDRVSRYAHCPVLLVRESKG